MKIFRVLQSGKQERIIDIPLLADHFLTLICNDHGIAKKSFEENALSALKEINWTGNIRELRNVIERLIILTNDLITKDDVERYANH
jgi:DNA-binding NtrC family response regulator